MTKCMGHSLSGLSVISNRAKGGGAQSVADVNDSYIPTELHTKAITTRVK
jgi:hypothetical protein